MFNRLTITMVLALLPATAVQAQHELENRTWMEVDQALRQGVNTAIITLGSTEQHGPHLALASDSAIGDCLARELAGRVGQALIAPNIRVGNAPYHMHFPGTINVRARILKSLVYEYVHSLAWHGFHHIAIIPTHGGNFAVAGELAAELGKLYPHTNIFAFSDADAFFGVLADAAERLGLDPAAASGHAGQAETALALACQPELVDMARAERGVAGDVQALTEQIYRAGTHTLSPTGVLGDPRGATATAGRAYLDSLVTLLADYVTQQREGWALALPGNLPYGGLPEPEGSLAPAIKARRNANFDRARQLLQDKQREQPENAMIALELARTDVLENRITAARTALEALLADTTDAEVSEKIHDELALIACYQGLFAEAAEHKLAARRIRGLRNDPEGEAHKLFYIAYFQLETGRADAALDSYRQALALAQALSDLNIDIEHLTGLALLRSGRLLEAEQRLRALADAVRDPEFHAHIRRFHHLNGEILLLHNRPEAASVNFQAAVQVYDHPLYRESMARARWQQGDLKGAVEELQTLVALTDARLDIPIHYVRAHYQLGQLHELLGDQEQAQKWYRRFLNFWGDSDLQLDEILDARKKLIQ